MTQDTPNNFIQEIKEEIRKDRLIAVWNKYGNIIVSLFIFVLVIVALSAFWNHYQNKQLTKRTVAFEQAIKGEKEEKIQKLSALKDNSSSGYNLMSTFLLAKEDIYNSKNILNDFIIKNDIELFYTEIAILKLAYSQINKGNMEEALQILKKITHENFLYIYALDAEITINIQKKKFDVAASKASSLLAIKNLPVAMKNRTQAVLEMLN